MRVAVCHTCPHRTPGPYDRASPLACGAHPQRAHCVDIARDNACPLGRFGGAPASVSSDLPMPAGGPGTELKKLLAKWGVEAGEGCACTARAAAMDRNGPAWCAANVETIVGWLREEAGKRGLLARAAARPVILRRLVRRAIANTG